MAQWIIYYRHCFPAFYSYFFGHNSPQWARASLFTRFLDHTQRRTTVGRTPLHEWWPSRRDLYLTTHNTHKRQTSMSPVGFEPTISAGERLQTDDLDSAVTGTGIAMLLCIHIEGDSLFVWTRPNLTFAGYRSELRCQWAAKLHFDIRLFPLKLRYCHTLYS